ncbi:Hypothetical predicted protein [Mytilus galloprovincialis]|uniref:BTB domain-containing protein n=1 Tax=Mytilus galloprovincialis TaxID=29158 RepID=A0A8B6CR34_MYTGA|nr:Hypothetical predicted protein [Mytilus galloprovincialis]
MSPGQYTIKLAILRDMQARKRKAIDIAMAKKAKIRKLELKSRSMFEGPLAEKGTVEIVDIEPEYFNMILQFIYKDKITVDSFNVKNILYGSEKYMLKLLTDECNAFLASHVDVDHACLVLQAAHDFNMEDLETKVLNFIFIHGSEVLDSKDFINLSAECLKLFLGSDMFRCEEEYVYRKMLHWGLHKCNDKSLATTDENIRECLGDLLYLIRFPVMKPQYFTEEVSCKSLLTATEKVKVYQHFNYMTTDIFPSNKHASISVNPVPEPLQTKIFCLD